jgi:apoptosis-inducing factor 2
VTTNNGVNTHAEASVAVLGGGYAGIRAAKLLDDVTDVTLVDPTEAFVHNVAAWRSLVEPEWLERIFLPYERLLARGHFVQDRAVAVEGTRVTLDSGDVLEPDYLVLATGSAYPFPAKSEHADVDAARSGYRDAHEALSGAERALILGAGPAGLELAGEIKARFPGKHVTVADLAGDVLSGPYDQELRDELRRQLAELGVELRLNAGLSGLPDREPATLAPVAVRTADGGELRADIWFKAFGVRPRTGFLDPRWVDARGYVRVDEHLRVHGEERVFAAGDISDADLDTAGVATPQAEVVAANVRALATGGELRRYDAQPALIAIPLGPEGGAGFLGDGVASRELIAEVKGRHMLVDNYAALFDAEPLRNEPR